MAGWEVIVLLAVVAYGVFLAYWLTATARRLDRLHKRADYSLVALEGALQQRAAVICVLNPASRPCAHAASVQVLDTYDAPCMRRRAEAEAELLATVPTTLGDNRDVTEAQIRVDLAIRFYNEAARAAQLVRERFWVRTFRLGGHAPVPHIYPVDDAEITAEN